MEVSNPTSPSATVTGTTDAQAAAVLSSDFETFLQMLTAQARYQDPLEPIDSSEYAAQLAQFSMVEQQVQSNDLLRLLGAQLGQGSIAQMASWIGMDARTTAAAPFDGQTLTIYPKSVSNAEEAILIVYDQDGREVQRQQIAADAAQVQWNGRSSDGTVAPSGLYSFAIETRTAGQSLGQEPAETYTRIIEARSQNGGIEFVLNGGSVVMSEDVVALREAT